MTNSSTPVTAFPPLPVRRRDVLETFDTAIKLYRRFYAVLLAWAALVHVAPAFLGVAIANLLPELMPLYQICAFCVQLFVQPILMGVVACCIAAAVRGQTVGFKQCWTFFRPRYWPTVGQFILTRFLAVVGWFIVVLGLVLVWALLVWASTASFPLPLFLNVLGTITYLVISLAVISVIGSVLTASMMVTPIVVCLEDDKRGGEAQTRAWQLFKGNWLRITWLYSLIGLAFLSSLGIVMGMWSLWDGLGGIRQAMEGMGTNPAMAVNFTAIMSVGTMICNPLIYLCSAVLYLDLRVRREALDLEWSAHVSAPPRAEMEASAAPSAAPRFPSEMTAAVAGGAEAPSFGGPPTPALETPPTFDALSPMAATPGVASSPGEAIARPNWEPAPPIAAESSVETGTAATISGENGAFAPTEEAVRAGAPLPAGFAEPAFSAFEPFADAEPVPAPEAGWAHEAALAPLGVSEPEPVPMPAAVPTPEPVPLPAELFIPAPPAPQAAPSPPASAPVVVAPAVPVRPNPPSAPPIAPDDDDFNPSSFG